MSRVFIIFSLCCATGFCGLTGAETPAPPRAADLQSLREMREAAKWRKRALLYNNDGNDNVRGAVTPEKFIAARTAWMAGSPVSSIFYCTGVFDRYTHKSSGSSLLANLEQYKGRNIDPLWAHQLIRQGKDTLDLMVQFGKQNNIEVFWSMRMNDNHDGYANRWDDSLMSDWKRMHPEYLMGKPGERWKVGDVNVWSSLDYANAPVRQKALDILTDVCANKDIDGVELDFLRSPPYFRESLENKHATPQNIALMDAFVRDVRRMTEEMGLRRGRPILVAVRVYDLPSASRAVGLDWEKWAKEGWIDLLIVGGMVQFAPWEIAVKTAHAHGIPCYPCVGDHRATALWSGDMRRFRGDCLAAWQSGADGLYLFNDWIRADKSLSHAEMAAPDALAKNPHTYQFFGGNLFNLSFVPDWKTYLMAVEILPQKTVFFEKATVSLKYPDSAYVIRYTTDGSPVTAASPAYEKTFAIERSTLVRAKGFSSDGGMDTAETFRQYQRRDSVHFDPEPLPLRVFGMPLGMGKTTLLTIGTPPKEGNVGILVGASDVDAQEEVSVYVNDHGPFMLPASIVDPGAQIKTAELKVPAAALRAGENKLTFIFEDNLNSSTSGFHIERVELAP